MRSRDFKTFSFLPGKKIAHDREIFLFFFFFFSFFFLEAKKRRRRKSRVSLLPCYNERESKP